MTTRYEVNYHDGHQLDLYLLNDYEVQDALTVHGEWDKWCVVVRDCGARRFKVPILTLSERTRPEYLWMSFYLLARAYAYLKQESVGRAERTENLDRVIRFCETGEQANSQCRIRKLYVDYLRMLRTEKPTFRVPVPRQEYNYTVLQTVGVPDIEDLSKFVNLVLRTPPQAEYCSGAYVPDISIEQRTVSSYEYAKFDTMIFQYEADAILCTLAE